jgi:hypothetical protein
MYRESVMNINISHIVLISIYYVCALRNRDRDFNMLEVIYSLIGLGLESPAAIHNFATVPLISFYIRKFLAV